MTAKTNTAGTPLPTQCHFSAKAHQGACHVARFDSHGRYILTGGADRAVRLWNASAARSEEGPTAIKTYSSGHSHEILAIDIASDNARFASGGGDKSVMLWDVTTSQILRRFSAHEGRINDIRFAGPTTSEQSSHGGSSSSATLLCTAGFDGVLRFYDLRAQGAWRPVMECKDARDAILCTCIQGHNVWTGSTDGVVRRYDVRAGALTEDTVDGELELLGRINAKHRAHLRSISVLLSLQNRSYHLMPRRRAPSFWSVRQTRDTACLTQSMAAYFRPFRGTPMSPTAAMQCCRPWKTSYLVETRQGQSRRGMS